MPRPATPPPPSAAGLGVFADNRKQPIHRWFPFVEGYSSHLVTQAIREAKDPSVVFDPFGGSGTTALTAALLGIDSAFTEANPYMAWVADVKVNQAALAAHSPGALSLLRGVARAPERVATTSRLDQHPLLDADRARNFFPTGVALQLVRFLDAVESELDGPARQLARLAAGAAAVPASNMLRRTDLRRRRNSEAKPLDLWTAIAANLQMILSDVADAGTSIQGTATQLANDARYPYTTPEPFTTIVTSPPYLNGTNYGRNTKLELLALGFLASERELETLRTREITAGINNVSARNPLPTEFAAVEAVAAEVAEVTYDQRIPKMIRAYFSDMAIVFAQLASQSSDQAEFWLDIGDSRYSGVSVPTHTLLITVAEATGWAHIGETPLRTRRSYDGTLLVQTLLKFRRTPE